MASLREARHDRVAAEAEEARLRNLLAAAMASHDRAEGAGWRITWPSVKGRVSTDWRLVAAAYRRVLEESDASIDYGAIEGLYTTTGEPTRSFRPTWQEEE
jgi:ADP-ribose pyrophosphatase YjhB (NUDIX family)